MYSTSTVRSIPPPETLKSHYARTLDASAIFNYGTLVRYAVGDFSSAFKSLPGHLIGPLVAAELFTRCALDVLYLHQAGPYFRQVIRVEEIVEDFFYRGADLDAFLDLSPGIPPSLNELTRQMYFARMLIEQCL